jgi:ABC-type glycerol-3-phosphate transport system substrate-binding protein
MVTRTLLRGGLAALAALFALSAPEAQAQTKIEFASWQLAEKGRAEKYNALLDKFAKDRPHIKLEKVVIPYPVFEQTMFTQAGQGGGPDVFFVADEALPKAIKAGFAEPLGDLVNLGSMNLTPMNQVAMSDGKQYGLAWEAITYNFIYNKELLASVDAKAPTTYE